MQLHIDKLNDASGEKICMIVKVSKIRTFLFWKYNYTIIYIYHENYVHHNQPVNTTLDKNYDPDTHKHDKWEITIGGS